jgi:hypothetical protein
MGLGNMSKRVCGGGLSCESICPAKSPGRECVSLYGFALLADTSRDFTPQCSEVLVSVGGV